MSATEMVEVGTVFIYVLHDLETLDLDPHAAGIHVVIYGHSHRPALTKQKGVLYLNPGGAGPQRFTLPATVALLTIEGTDIKAELIDVKK
jgi:predicted phosphodiesterase